MTEAEVERFKVRWRATQCLGMAGTRVMVLGEGFQVSEHEEGCDRQNCRCGQKRREQKGSPRDRQQRDAPADRELKGGEHR